MEHTYGWKREKKDPRDHRLTFDRSFLLPEAVDLRSFCSPVRNQEALGACTGFSFATGMMEFLQNKFNKPFVQMSPMYSYYYARVLEGSVGYDSGAFIRDNFKGGAKQGTSPERDYPYNPDKFREAPSSTANGNAYGNRIIQYRKLSGLHAIKANLSQGFGCCFGFVVRESFESSETAKTGIMSMPKWNEKIRGGHAVFCCGYKDNKSWSGGGYLIVKNSWGPEWGDKGYFYMPYAYFGSAWFSLNVTDIWTATA